MKTSDKHQQYLEQIAVTSGPGFQQIDRKSAKDFRFYWANAKGQAVLLSKSYKSATSRDKAQQETQSGTYALAAIASDNVYQVVVETKGKRVIARSKAYAKAAARDAALAELTQALTDSHPEQQPEKSAPIATPPLAQRHRFQLVFYQHDGPNDWQGILSHPLSQKKVKLQGVESEKITSFIKEHLAQATPAATPPPMITKNTVAVKIMDADNNTPIPMTETLSVLLTVADLPRSPLTFRVQLQAKSLQNGQKNLLLETDHSITAGQPLALEANTEPLKPGLYRITAKLFATKGNAKPLTGDQLVWLTPANIALSA